MAGKLFNLDSLAQILKKSGFEFLNFNYYDEHYKIFKSCFKGTGI
jgi:hypothetical protein